MSNGTKKNVKIIAPSSLDDGDACMLVTPLLREPVFMRNAYQPDQVIKLSRISKPGPYELIDLKRCNPLSMYDYGLDKRVLLHCDYSLEITHDMRIELPKDSARVHKRCEKRRKRKSAKRILLKLVVRIVNILISQIVRYSIEWLSG